MSSKVSALAAADSLDGTEMVYVVKAGVSRRTTTGAIADLAEPFAFNLGTIAVSTPWLSLDAELNDGASVGQTRVTFSGITANWNRANVGGGQHPQFQLSTESHPWFRLSPNTTPALEDPATQPSENGGIQAELAFLSTRADSPGKKFGFRHNNYGVGAMFADDGSDFAYFKYDGGVGAGSSVIELLGTNRGMIVAVNGAMVLGSDTGHYELESGGTEVDLVPYLLGTSIGCEAYYHNEGQTSATSTPLGAYSTSATVPAFSWGVRGVSSKTKKGHLYRDGSVFMANTTEPTTPSGGGVLYVEGGSLRFKGSGGTVTVLGAA